MAGKRKSPGRGKATKSKEAPDGNELLVMELREIHSAEHQLSRVVPKLAKSAQSEKLRNLLEERLSQGEQLIGDVEMALEELDASPRGAKNPAAEGLIKDVREHVQELDAGPALDAKLIASLQKTEHYCIAAWGTAKALARAVGQKGAVKAMERAVKEGSRLDERLTTLAEREVNPAVIAQASERMAPRGERRA